MQKDIVQCMTYVDHVVMEKCWIVLMLLHQWRYLLKLFIINSAEVFLFRFPQKFDLLEKNAELDLCMFYNWVDTKMPGSISLKFQIALSIVIIWWLHLVAFSQPDDLLSSKIQSLCPTITSSVCCTAAQFDNLRSQVQQVRILMNLFMIFCPMISGTTFSFSAFSIYQGRHLLFFYAVKQFLPLESVLGYSKVYAIL